MESFLLDLPNFDLALKSCHFDLPASNSLLALIFLGLGALTASFSASESFCASGYMVAPAELTTPGAGVVATGVADADGGASAFRLLEIGRISLDLRVSVVS